MSVVKVIVPGLEDDPSSRNRQLGSRAARAMLGLAMRIVFVGPTLGDEIPPLAGCRSPPTGPQGDVAQSRARRRVVIGIIDGVFENVPAVWHKEILFALSEGVRVLGAASMGALRAAECAAFGMEGIGMIFARYASGDLVDDDAVAQLHAPEILGFAALSEPLVNVEATLLSLKIRLVDR